MQRSTKGLFGVSVLAGLSVFVGAAQAGVTYDALPGSGTLTANGWTSITKTTQDGIDAKAKDYSISGAAAGTNGVWNINDNNSPVNAYMYMKRDPSLDGGYGLSSSNGVVMARIKCVSGTNTGGTFGYSIAGSNFGGVLGIRSGVVKFRDGSDIDNAANFNTDTTTDYRVYAVQWTTVGGFKWNAWISNGNNWSANPSDWTQMVTNSTQTAAIAFQDLPNPPGNGATTSYSGLFIGSMSSSGNASNTMLDWLHFNKNDIDNDGLVRPWDQGPTLAPEPASMGLLLLGLPLLRLSRSKRA